MGHIFSPFKRLRDDERGNAIVIVAATIPLIFGAAALGIDTIQLSLAKRELQRSADSAALAGAHAVAQISSGKPAAARAAALRALQLGKQVPLSTAAVVDSAPTTGSNTGNADAVEVRLTTSPTLHFRAMFTNVPPVVTARAVASRVGSTPACVLALHPTADKALEMTGNYELNSGCGIASNSNDSDQSIRITGNFRLAGNNEISAVGGIDVSGNASVPSNNQRFPRSNPTIDPFAGVALPTTPTSCTYNNLDLNGVTRTLAPGRYCGFLKISGSSRITFSPGVHIIAGETFSINGGSVTGTGVTFVMTRHNSVSDKWASLDWNGNSNISLAAPTVSSGQATAGLLVMQDRATPSNNNKNSINGNLTMNLKGTLYFPNNELQWNGNTVTTAECLRVIGRILGFNGNPGVRNNCTADDGVMAATMIRRVRLVE